MDTSLGLQGHITALALPPGWGDADDAALWAALGREPDQLRVPRWMLDEYQARLREVALQVYDTHNVACNAGRTNILTYLTNGITSGTVSSFPGVNVFAVGVGASPTFASTDTTLVSEYYRQQVSSYTISGNQAIITTNFSTTVANTTYTEAGIFAVTGSLPGTINTGTLFGHAAFSYTKTSNLTLQNQYTLTLN